MAKSRAFSLLRNPHRQLYRAPRAVHSVEVIEDSKIPNAATIKIVKQDHTLGNMLRASVTLF